MFVQICLITKINYKAMKNSSENVEDIIKQSINDAIKGMGKVTILVAGKTGVGKSTLINSIFRGDFAETGSGRPVTQEIMEISKPNHPLTIIDTKGLEVKNYEEIKKDLEKEIKDRSGSEDPNRHIHVAWICIQSSSDRIEDAEIDLCKFLTEKEIPVVVVITKSKKNDPFVIKVKEIMRDTKNIIGVRSIEEYDEELEATRPSIGLDDLIEVTGKLLPESQARAYSNALSTKNKRALAEKKKQAEVEINISVGLASAAAAIPIPFSDAFALVPIQIGMLAKIGSTYGVEASTSVLTTLVSSILGVSATTMIGRSLVSSILKMIPGAGSAVGGTVAAAAAGGLTKVLGNAYVAVLHEFCESNPGKPIDIQHISKELKKRFE
jgi:uncharacterized protein (DUF697 family)/GTP-binding protein EngB required for normal cell division